MTIRVSTSAPPVTSAVGGLWRRRKTGAAVSSLKRAAITNARVYHAVEQIGRQIGETVDPGQHEDCRLHQGQVEALQRLDQQSAKPRISKYGLDRDNAADQKAEILREHGNRRDQRIAQCVAENHQPLG